AGVSVWIIPTRFWRKCTVSARARVARNRPLPKWRLLIAPFSFISARPVFPCWLSTTPSWPTHSHSTTAGLHTAFGYPNYAPRGDRLTSRYEDDTAGRLRRKKESISPV